MKKYFLFIFILIATVMGGSVMAGGLEKHSGKEKRYSQSVNLIEITIDRPASEVWPHLLNLNSWVKQDFTLEHVSGKHNEEGEILRVYSTAISREETEKYPPHLVKNMKLVPQKLYAFVNPHKNIEPSGNFERARVYSTSHALVLTEYDGKTKVSLTIFVLYETLSQNDYEIIDNDILPKFSQDLQKRWGKRYLPTLKELVENGHPTAKRK